MTEQLVIKGDSLAPISSLDDPNKPIAFFSRQVNIEG